MKNIFLVKNKIVYRQECAVTIQRYTRGWLVRRQIGYVFQVKRALRKMSNNLAQIRAAYRDLPDFQGKGYANVSMVNFILQQPNAS